MALTFFTQTDPLGGFLNWVLQTVAPQSSLELSFGLGADGDIGGSNPYNGKDAVTVTYKCFLLKGTLTQPVIGALAGGYHIDSYKIDYSLDYPTMTVNAHKHTTRTHTLEGRKYSSTEVLPAQWGVPSSLAGFALIDDTCGMKSASYGLSATHVDELDADDGAWLGGDNHDGVETLNIGVVGAVEKDVGFTLTATWHINSSGSPTGNTAANSTTIDAVRHKVKN